MSVLIKGMEMPQNCYSCWLGHKCPEYEALLWNEIDKERKADCPLVPVPPHGDLVDRDALKEKIWQARVQCQMLDDTQTADKIMHGIYRVEQILAETPAIIEAEGDE